MARKLIRTFFLVLLCLVLVTPQGWAAAGTPPAAPEEEKVTASKGGPRKQLATIVFAGLGGAVLGLSTLSFYGRPQDYLSNIGIGLALGIITGTIYVTYKAASKPDEFYGTPDKDKKTDLGPSQTSPGRAPPITVSLYRLSF